MSEWNDHEAVLEKIYEDLNEELGREPTEEELRDKVESLEPLQGS